MENKTANQQQTLFRFTSIRPPDLYDEKKKNLKFIFWLDDGFFKDAVDNRPASQSKWEAMKEEAENYPDKFTVTSLKAAFPGHVEMADWLVRNRQSATPQQIVDKLSAMALFPDTDITKFWDNLFLQIIVENDFYVKELLMQLLVLNNLLAEITPFDPKVIDEIKSLTNATVVLPEYLFTEDPADEPVVTALAVGGDPIYSSKQVNQALNVSIAKYSIARNNRAVKELEALQEEYFSNFKSSFELDKEDYERAVQAAYNAATIVEKERIDCPSGCPEIYYEYTNLKLPRFDFSPSAQISTTVLDELSSESLYVVQSLIPDLKPYQTFDSIIARIDESTREFYASYFANLPETAKSVTIGSMTFMSIGAGSSTEFLSGNQLPFTAYLQHTQVTPKTGKVMIAIDMGFAGSDAISCSYSATFTGSPVMGTAFIDTTAGNILNLILFSDPVLTIPGAETEFDLEAEITLSNGMKIEIDSKFVVKGVTRGVATVVSQVTTPTDSKAFTPQIFGVRQLGIEDYKKVVAEVCCYREAEVAHIENIMAKEFKSKTTTRERIEETTVTTENEVEVENLTDSTTTERFEMQTEIAKLLQQDKQFGAYAQVRGGNDKITFETGANYATNTAKEESNRQAVTQSKEITQRAMERIVSRFREEMVKKVTESFKEETSHIFDNRGEGAEHVSGVYRYINAIYKNQVFNYGKRLIYEFMVPQPSKLYEYGMKTVSGGNKTPYGPELVEPQKPDLIDASALDDINYLEFASDFGADVEAPPIRTMNIGKAYHAKGGTGSIAQEFNDIQVPEGYKVSLIYYNYSHRKAGSGNTNLHLTIGNFTFPIYKSGSSVNGYPTTSSLLIPSAGSYAADTVPVSVNGWDVGSLSLNLTVTLLRTDEAYKNWQLKTYNIIMAAYQQKLDEYYDKKNAERVSQEENVMGTNPLFYRQVEQAILKKFCLSYIMDESKMGFLAENMIGDAFSDYKIKQDQYLDNYASHVKFMEQAFEWEIMSYKFYPYYWGKRADWMQLFQSDNDDPLFRSFMQAGMARVLVTVRPGFDNAVMHYMKFGQIWNGGQVPVIGDPLYMSIVDELKEQEYTVEETWETVLPTSLIGLQRGGVSVDADGLPCGSGCEDGPNPLVPNMNKLKDIIKLEE